MTRRFGFPRAAAAAAMSTVTFSGALHAAELPPIKASDDNKVAECATPGRLMVYLKSRNTKLDSKYEVLATEYMRHGEALGLRWDYAFFQMLLETGYLKYTGDVKPEQNNFAGLGATGGGVRGESFKDVSTGARAHLEHLLMYSGEKVENATAQRTRNIQEWGVLTSWQQSIKGPITFAQLAKQWAPGTKAYAGDIKSIAERFFEGPCKGEDPNPELVAEARGQSGTADAAGKPAKVQKTAASEETPASPAAAPPAATAPSVKPDTKGAELARGAGETARAEGNAARAGLGAATLAKAQEAPAAPPAATVAAVAPVAPVTPTKQAAASPSVTILNPAAAPAEERSDKTAAPDASATIETASVAGAAKDAAKPDKKAAAKCRVWTASYGGAKAIIIKATADQTTNYTVLDVNEGSEKREAEAYISAYAKGGESVGEFASQTQALDKAFELCPEG